MPSRACGEPTQPGSKTRASLCCAVVVLMSGCVFPDFHRLPDATGGVGSSNLAGNAGSAGRGIGGAATAGTMSAIGGAPYIGGSPGIGDAGDGGLFAAGGISALGGNFSTAGAPSNGGAPYAGGSPATGGATVNGDGATGGTTFTTGGVATGGVATGGIPATGLPFVPATALSCQNLNTKCQGENCCTSIAMPGGTYPMGRSTAGTDSSSGNADELPEHSATVAPFALDKYEVTVGRFRTFVGDYDEWHKTDGNPKVTTGTGTGGHPIAANTGWGQSWTPASSDLPADSTALIAALKCNASFQTWKDSADTNEAYAINCVSWYMAFAFCIWDGGRLPTEAEWEYAAAGGTQNRLYPWGSQTPDYNRANYTSSPAGSAFVAVGSKLTTGGAGYFGHADLAGSMWEWAFDWYNGTYYGTAGTTGVSCNNCANTTTASNRVIRGGGWYGGANYLRAASRDGGTPASRHYGIGFRCARTP